MTNEQKICAISNTNGLHPYHLQERQISCGGCYWFSNQIPFNCHWNQTTVAVPAKNKSQPPSLESYPWPKGSSPTQESRSPDPIDSVNDWLTSAPGLVEEQMILWCNLCSRTSLWDGLKLVSSWDHILSFSLASTSFPYSPSLLNFILTFSCSPL